MPTESTGINALTEAIAMRSETTDKAIKANTTAQAENTRAIAQLGTKIDKLSDTVSNQSASIERLERGIDKLVDGMEAQKNMVSELITEGRSQRQTVDNLIKLCTALVAERAS